MQVYVSSKQAGIKAQLYGKLRENPAYLFGKKTVFNVTQMSVVWLAVHNQFFPVLLVKKL